MLVKLIKYDLKSLFKTLTPVFIITLLLSLLTRTFNFLGDKFSIIQYPAGFITGLCIVTIIAVPFLAFILGIVKYYKNMIKNEGYLTHTLPVKKSSLVLSKLLTSSLAVLSALIISIVAILIAFRIDRQIIDALKVLYDQMMNYNYWLLPLIIISILTSYIINILLVYASISLGQKHSGNKLVYSIVYGVVIYNVTQILSTILLFIPYLFDKNYFAYLEQEFPTSGYVNILLIFVNFINILFAVVYYIITVRNLEKKLNLE